MPTNPTHHAPKLLRLILLLLSVPHLALAADRVGIYWDLDSTQSTLDITALPASIEGYLVLEAPSDPLGVLGWELCVGHTGTGVFTSWNLAGDAVNADTAPCFRVGLLQPLPPVNGAITLASFQFLVQEATPEEFRLVATVPATYARRMSYETASSPGQRRTLSTTTGSAVVAQLTFDGPLPGFDVTSLDFGAVALGTTAELAVSVTNAGGAALDLDISQSGDPVYGLAGPAGAISVPAGGMITVPVTFAPDAISSFEGMISFGVGLPTVALAGSGREAVMSYTVSAALEFGALPLVGFRDLVAVIANTGDFPIPIAPRLVGCGPEYTILAGSSPLAVMPGTAQEVVIRFQPTAVGAFDCQLEFAPGLDIVPLHGSGRLSEFGWNVPTEVVFGPVDWGTPTAANVLIENTGELIFSIDAQLAGCGSEFEIVIGGGFRLIEPGASHQVGIRYTPTSPDSSSCWLALGDFVPAVRLVGVGTNPIVPWRVTPTFLEFGSVYTGEYRFGLIYVTNTGVEYARVFAELADPLGPFSLTAGAGEQVLLPGQRLVVQIRFAPVAVGEFSTSLHLGPGLPEVPLSGVGRATSSCTINPDTLTFPPLSVGGRSERTFRVYNTGQSTLSLTPSADSPHFTVTAPVGPFELVPTSNVPVTVSFVPQALGAHQAVIDLGTGLCGPIVCLGSAVEQLEQAANAVGFFFDEAYRVNQIDATSPQPFNGYLVLFNPTPAVPVDTWELRLQFIGDVIVLGTSLAGTGASNSTQAPNYIVGIGTPLPSASAVRLMTVSLLNLNSFAATIIELEPVVGGSDPGHMIWSGGGSGPVRVATTTGLPQVAAINTGAPVGTVAHTPAATLDGHHVRLSWQHAGIPSDSYRIYRRVADGAAVWLVDGAPILRGDRVEFVDEPGGIATETSLFYSYSVVNGAVEQARSPEVEVAWPGLPAALTRLLPNVPNPFNPRTEIHFETARDGMATVAIFDATGRRVATLVDGFIPAGRHFRFWAGLDAGGRDVASGAYYVRLVTEGAVDRRKILLLK